MGRIKKMTQAQRVLRFMETHKKGITAKQAHEALGCYDLQGRIRDLKEEGYPIVGEWTVVKNRFNEKVRIKQYTLVER